MSAGMSTVFGAVMSDGAIWRRNSSSAASRSSAATSGASAGVSPSAACFSAATSPLRRKTVFFVADWRQASTASGSRTISMRAR